MKTNKLLFATWLLLAGGGECWSMWRQLGEPVSPLICLGLTLFLCGLVLRSAFKRPDPLNPSSKGWRTFWTVIGVLSVVGIFGAFIEMLRPRQFHHVIEVGELHIPLDDCLAGMKKVMTDKQDRTAFCICIATKLGSDAAIAKTERARLERGNFVAVMTEAMQQKGPLSDRLAECYGQGSMVWTEGMLEKAEEDCIVLIQADTALRDHDAQKYCACAIARLATYPPSTIAGPSFDSTGMREKIETECLEASKK